MSAPETLPAGDVATPLKPMQQMTIANLRRGREGTVPVTITAEARAEGLLAARERFPLPDGGRATVTVLLARVLARTLADHPALHATLTDEALIHHADVGLGVAVAAEDGSLAVPVVPRAQALEVPELAAALADLSARARARKLRVEQVRGGSFTLSSTGMVRLPILGTPLLPPGHTGILLAACAAERPVVQDGALAAGLVMPLSLTFDHAAVNGIPAVRFLHDLVGRIEQPDAWL